MKVDSENTESISLTFEHFSSRLSW